MSNRRQFLQVATSFGATLALGNAPARAQGKPWVERREFYPQGVASATGTTSRYRYLPMIDAGGGGRWDPKHAFFVPAAFCWGEDWARSQGR